ncbi:hypothetical protein H4R18_003062 [Coemansia javaensis]|uniref:tRNA-5-taurinomethyluridine 2-sulfurtransferase n=1 Tax=Coemansia javaensis TaxID=2761396 RepID=A0A9W8LGV7_9FUNG|nr:hypothetical protein H4R18_003062 [Coemansia javaensis]
MRAALRCPRAADWHGRIRAGDKVYVGMSGGVDSSVAAHLLRQRGADVEAVFMRNWDTRDERGECPSERDWRDVQRVCAQLGIRCHQISLVKQYWNLVFATALDDFARGRTPNPDVLCNSQIKFGVLLAEVARRLPAAGAWFATGHYARTAPADCDGDDDSGGGGSAALLRGVDARKDQSYYLSAVAGTQLRRVLFPLGALDKAADVRPAARSAGLATAAKEESMGICFVGERRRFDEFLAEYLPQRDGEILSSDMRVIGRHRGLFTRTIGQAAGVPGMAGKWYIYAKDPATNRMYAVPSRDHPLLRSKVVSAGPAHWVSGRGGIRAEFENAQYGVASGQYLVLYAGDHCLGCAQIQ